MTTGLVWNCCCRRTRGVEVIRSVTTGGWWKGSSTGFGPRSRGVICHVRSLGRVKQFGNFTAVVPGMGPGIVPCSCCSQKRTRWVRSIGTSVRMRRSLAHISMRRTRPALTRTQGAVSNYKNLPFTQVEPAGHGIGRSRGGWMTKIHHGGGRPWTRPNAVPADKRYSNGVIRRSFPPASLGSA